MVYNTIGLDMTNFKKLTGVLVPGQEVELKLLEFYSKTPNADKDPVRLMEAYIADFLKKNKDSVICDELTYNNHILYCIGVIEMTILYYIPTPVVSNIEYSKYIQNNGNIILEYRYF